VTGNVTDKVLLLTGLTAQNLPETVGLDKVLICDGELLGDDGAGPLLVLLGGLDGLVLQGTEGGGVVRVRTVVTVDAHDAIAVERSE
jgi:hypothetical protein